MTILAFWGVYNDDIERHDLDNVSDIDAFRTLWGKREELDVRFYSPESDYTLPVLTASEFEDDYNNEELDGGMWTKVMKVEKEDVLNIIREDSNGATE